MKYELKINPDPIHKPVRRNVYDITITSMHGDADNYDENGGFLSTDQTALIVGLQELLWIARERMGYLNTGSDWRKAIADRPDLGDVLEYLLNHLSYQTHSGCLCHYDSLEIRYFDDNGVEFGVTVESIQ